MRERKSHIITSFSVEDNEENRKLLGQLEDLARKDGWGMSRLIREAVLEYAKRHHPGNPQLALAHWTEGMAMPQTLAEACQHKRVYFSVRTVAPRTLVKEWRCADCHQPVDRQA